MKSGLSMTSRAEVTTRYARSFRAADKRTKGRILDEVVSVTGWSRDNARRRLTSAAQSPPGAGRSVTTRPRKQRATKFSYDALKGPATGLGRLGRAVRQVPRGVDAHATGRPGTARRAGRRRRPVQHGGAGGIARDVGRVDRPLPAAGEGHRPDQGCLHHETLAAAAVFDQDPQGRR